MPGVGDHDVEPAEGSTTSVDDVLHRGGVGDVGAEADRRGRRVWAAASAVAAGSRSTSATRAPRSARCLAVSKPMPRAAPVTSATLPLTEYLLMSGSLSCGVVTTGEVPAEEVDLVGEGLLLPGAVVDVEVVDGIGRGPRRTGRRVAAVRLDAAAGGATASFSPTWTSSGVRSREAKRIGRLNATSSATRAHTSLRQVGPASAV